MQEMQETGAPRDRRRGLDPWVGKIPWRRAWQLTPVFLSGEPHGQRSLKATVRGVPKGRTCLKWLSMHMLRIKSRIKTILMLLKKRHPSSVKSSTVKPSKTVHKWYCFWMGKITHRKQPRARPIWNKISTLIILNAEIIGNYCLNLKFFYNANCF